MSDWYSTHWLLYIKYELSMNEQVGPIQKYLKLQTSLFMY